VTSHNKLDLDQQAIEINLKNDDFTKAKQIYQNGAHSGARSVLTLATPFSVSFLKSAAVVQGNVNGILYSSYGTGVTSMKVTYGLTSAEKCVDNVAAPNNDTTKCFTTNAAVTVAGTNVGLPTDVKNQYRTLAGFSTGVQSKFTAMTADRQVIWNKFKNYYSSGTYANDYVMAAFDGSGVWSGKSAVARKEGVKKGTAYMNNWMYVIREFEDAIHDCKTGNKLNNMDAVHAWDEGVAFYTGSLEGINAGGKQGGSCTASDSTGCMIHALADKRCANYKTCVGGTATGPSRVNKKLFEQFGLGRDVILKNKCDDAVRHLAIVVQQMIVPLVQGALRYAYKVDKLSGGDKEKAEGAVFAAAVLPLVKSCDAAKATLISDNMKIDATQPMKSGFAAVKSAFESTYRCAGITCTDVGGLLKSDGNYYAEFAPCLDSSLQPGGTSSFAMPLRPISMLLACVVSAAVYW
jgi:hypothetical protein